MFNWYYKVNLRKKNWAEGKIGLHRKKTSHVFKVSAWKMFLLLNGWVGYSGAPKQDNQNVHEY